MDPVFRVQPSPCTERPRLTEFASRCCGWAQNTSDPCGQGQVFPRLLPSSRTAKVLFGTHQSRRRLPPDLPGSRPRSSLAALREEDGACGVLGGPGCSVALEQPPPVPQGLGSVAKAQLQPKELLAPREGSSPGWLSLCSFPKCCSKATQHQVHPLEAMPDEPAITNECPLLSLPLLPSSPSPLGVDPFPPCPSPR